MSAIKEQSCPYGPFIDYSLAMHPRIWKQEVPSEMLNEGSNYTWSKSFTSLRTRILLPEDGMRVKALRDAVIGDLCDPDHYRPQVEAPTFIDDHLARVGGLAIGVEQEEVLLAYSTLSDGETLIRSMPRESQLPVNEAAPALFFSSAMVLPHYRGRGLHHHLICVRKRLCDHWGVRQRLATIAPSNWRSWQNFAIHGMPACGLVERRLGVLRLLAYGNPIVAYRPEPDTEVLVPLDDLDSMQQRFSDGMLLWQCRQKEGKLIAVFHNDRGGVQNHAADAI